MSWSEEEGAQAEVNQAVGQQDIEGAVIEADSIEGPEVKLFNKWSLSDIEITDISLSVS